MRTGLDRIRAEIIAHPANAWAHDLGYEPVYSAAPGSREAEALALLGVVGLQEVTTPG